MAPGKKLTARKRTGAGNRIIRHQVNPLRLRPWKDQMRDEDIQTYNYMVFDEPELKRYTSANGNTQFKRLRIPVRNPQVNPPHNNLVGYIPLPLNYLPYWKQLCYTIVYYKVMHQALGKSGHRNDKVVQSGKQSTSTMLKYYLYCRGLIIEEIFNQKGKAYFELPTFDEFIIKERFDLHWLEDEEISRAEDQPGAFFGRSIFLDQDVVNALGEWKSIISLFI